MSTARLLEFAVLIAAVSCGGTRTGPGAPGGGARSNDDGRGDLHVAAIRYGGWERPAAFELCDTADALALCRAGLGYRNGRIQQSELARVEQLAGPRGNLWGHLDTARPHGGGFERRNEVCRFESTAWRTVERVPLGMRAISTGVGTKGAGLAYLHGMREATRWIHRGLSSEQVSSVQLLGRPDELIGLSDGRVVVRAAGKVAWVSGDGDLAVQQGCASRAAMAVDAAGTAHMVCDRTEALHGDDGSFVWLELSPNGVKRSRLPFSWRGASASSLDVAGGTRTLVLSTAAPSETRRSRIYQRPRAGAWRRVSLPDYAGHELRPRAAVVIGDSLWVSAEAFLGETDCSGVVEMGVLLTTAKIAAVCEWVGGDCRYAEAHEPRCRPMPANR